MHTQHVLCSDGTEHVNPYYNLLEILKFENIYRLKVSLFTYKLKNDKSNTTAVLLNILTPASEIHSYNTRYAINQNFFKQAFTNISKMQLMERDATGVLACNVAFLVIMNGECFLVIERGIDVFHVWNFIYM